MKRTIIILFFILLFFFLGCLIASEITLEKIDDDIRQIDQFIENY